MGPILPLILLLIFGCSTPRKAPESLSRSDQKESHQIWVVNHGWHTGVIIEWARLEAYLPSLRQRFSDHVYVEVGWGDAAFYQAETINPALIARAILLPTSPGLHVAGFDAHPGTQFANREVVRLKLSQADHARLAQFISSSFAIDEQGKPVVLGKGVYGNSQIYLATGTYHAFNTCNQWTAKALSSGGMEINPSLALTPWRVMSAVRADGAP